MTRLILAVLALVTLALAACSQGVQGPPSQASISNTPGNAPELKSEVPSCVTEIEGRIARGDSLKGIIDDSTPVLMYRDYYLCNPLQRDDIVAYHYPPSPVPSLKIVKAIPGDTFALREENGTHLIIINGVALKNIDGTPYTMNNPRVLAGYVDSYNGRIPAGATLILGTAGDSLDSRRFGLVGISDLVGKVEVATGNTSGYADLLAGNFWAYRSATCSSGWGAQCTATATCPSGTTIQAYRALDAGCGGGTPSHAVGSLDNTGGCSLGGTSCSKTTSYCSEQQIVAAVGIVCTSN